MAVLFIILLPLLFAGVWAFANYLPNTDRRHAVQRYNRLLAVIALLSPIGVGFYFWQISRQQELTSSLPVLVVLASIFVIALILLLGSALRMMLFDNEQD